MKRLFLGLCLLISFSAWSGKDGGGGGVLLCPGEPMHLLDLHEASLPQPAFGADYLEILEQIYQSTDHAAAGLTSSRVKRLKAMVELIRGKIKWVDQLPREANDQGFTPRANAINCRLKWIAFYQDSTSQLFILKSDFDALSEVDKAGLVLHEALYLMARVNHSYQSSQYVREVVASAMSHNPLFPLQLDRLMGSSPAWLFFTPHIFVEQLPADKTIELQLVSLANTYYPSCDKRGSDVVLSAHFCVSLGGVPDEKRLHCEKLLEWPHHRVPRETRLDFMADPIQTLSISVNDLKTMAQALMQKTRQEHSFASIQREDIQVMMEWGKADACAAFSGVEARSRFIPLFQDFLNVDRYMDRLVTDPGKAYLAQMGDRTFSESMMGDQSGQQRPDTIARRLDDEVSAESRTLGFSAEFIVRMK